VAAGESAEREARRSTERAARLRADAARLDERAGAFRAGAEAERAVAAVLATLDPHGYYTLHDRRWPGTRDSNIDHVVVGPSGVYVIDTKRWRGDVEVAGGCLTCDGEDRTEEAAQVLAATAAVAAVAAEAGLPAVMANPVILLAGRALDTTVGEVMVCGEQELVLKALRAGRHLTQHDVDAVLRALLAGLPPASAPPPAPPEDAVQLGFMSAADLDGAALDGALRRPIDGWMTFLHPSQSRLVTRVFRGPARLRGGTGTGKTVVALHRVAHHARLGFTPVLYATYSRTLPHVFRDLFRGLAPNAGDAVEFANIHRWARRFLVSRGIEVPLDGDAARAAYAAAWQRAGAGTPLDTTRTDAAYWRDEISGVIKGGGLELFDDYANRARTGRGVAISPAQRERCWALYEAYQEELAARDVADYEDLVSAALRQLEAEPLERPYRCVVVDEVQDCTLQDVRLMAAATGGGDDALLLVGDGQQSIFPAGFRMVDVPLDVTGRVVTLQTNYRTTRQIAEAAYRFLGDDEFDDCEGTPTRRERVDAMREGPPPAQLTFGSQDEQAHALLTAITERLAEPYVEPSDVGVLVPFVDQVDRVVRVLVAAGLHAHGLTDKVVPTGIRVGTWHSSKGLEFKHVFMPFCADRVAADSPKADRRNRAAFVAMTRARDTLWMGRVSGR
jgi:hypothetical protein